MTVFTETRDSIADNLDNAALYISHFGLSTSNAFDTNHNVNLAYLGPETALNVSPIGAVVMAYHRNDVGVGWSIPAGWNNGDYWSDYPALNVFAKYLALSVEFKAGLNTVEVIKAWLQQEPTAEEVTDWLRTAAIAVRNARPDSALLSAIA